MNLIDEESSHEIPPRLRGFIAFGLAFFYFGMSLVPDNMSFIVKLLGFAPGDRIKAASLLEQCKNIPACGKSIEASLMLYALRFWLSDGREVAPEILKQLREQMPNSPLLYLISGFQAMITDHDSTEAVKCYRRGGELVQVPQLKIVFHQSLAWAHFVREVGQEFFIILLLLLLLLLFSFLLNFLIKGLG